MSITASRSHRARVFAKVCLIALVAICAAGTRAQSTEISYQGQLQNSSTLANGSFDFEFVLYDALSGGAQIGAILTRNAVTVSNGAFGVRLDFGANFPGAARFLEIHVRPSGVGTFTTLLPRESFTSAPYSIKALNADTAANALQLGSVPAGQFLQTNGSGAGLTNLNAGSITTGTVSNARLGQLPTANIADGAITAPKIAAGQAVKSLSVGPTTLTDNVTLAAGNNIGMTTAGNTVTISSTSGGVAGSGTPSTVPLWSGVGTSLGNSQISQDSVGIRMPNNVAFAAGAQGYAAGFGSPNGETGLTISSTGGPRADLRFDGTTVKLVARPAGSGPPSDLNGIVLRTDGNVSLGYGAINVPGAKLHVAASINGEPQGTAIYGVTYRDRGIGIHGAANPGTVNAFAGVFDGTVAVNGVLVADQVVVNRSLKLDGLAKGGAGSTLCLSSANGGTISYCSSSRRYKTDFKPFNAGLGLIRQLEPIAYKWKSTGAQDIGLGAEDVAKIDPLFVTYNDQGQVEGVKYDRLAVVFVNAFKEQQAQIEAQQKLIQQQQRQIESLIKVVCAAGSAADICHR